MPSPKLDIDLLVRETFVCRVEHYATVGSTNDRARECLADGAGPLPLLIVADEQTAGRGRGANRWWTGKGSLACSLIVGVDRFGLDRADAPLVALAAAVAVAETVAPLLGSHTVGLHWPNDVIAAGRKLAGILVEVLSNRWLVVGIGLNTNNSLRDAPQDLQATATTLIELTGISHDRTQVLLTLLQHLEEAFRRLVSGPDEIVASANTLCLQHGQELTVQLGRRRISGRCRGIASDGALLLDTPQGPEKLYSGVLR